MSRHNGKFGYRLPESRREYYDNLTEAGQAELLHFLARYHVTLEEWLGGTEVDQTVEYFEKRCPDCHEWFSTPHQNKVYCPRCENSTATKQLTMGGRDPRRELRWYGLEEYE